MILHIDPLRTFSTKALLPADPFVAQAALLRAALAHGTSHIGGLPDDPDIAVMLDALRALGCEVERSGDSATMTPPAEGLRRPAHDLYLDNASYALRLLAGLCAAQPWPATLMAQPPLLKRNVERALEPMRLLGANIRAIDRGTPPVYSTPGTILSGGRIDLPIPNAYVKGGLLALAAAARTPFTMTEPSPSRDAAERLLGCTIEQGERYTVHSTTAPLRPLHLALPADTALADSVAALSILRPGSNSTVHRRLGTPLECRALELIARVGGTIRERDDPWNGVDLPTQTLDIGSSHAAQVRFTPDELLGLQSELPLLAVVAAASGGTLEARGMIDLRQQRCDRIAALVDALAAYGAETEELDDGLIVRGQESLHGDVELSAYADPGIAPALMLLAALADAPSTLHDVPDDFRTRTLAQLLGARVESSTVPSPSTTS